MRALIAVTRRSPRDSGEARNFARTSRVTLISRICATIMAPNTTTSSTKATAHHRRQWRDGFGLRGWISVTLSVPYTSYAHRSRSVSSAGVTAHLVELLLLEIHPRRPGVALADRHLPERRVEPTTR